MGHTTPDLELHCSTIGYYSPIHREGAPGRLLHMANMCSCAFHTAGFLNLTTIDILGWIFFFFFAVCKSCPVYDWVFNSPLAFTQRMPGVFPWLWQPKMSPDIVKCFLEGGDWTVKVSQLSASGRLPRFCYRRKMRFPTRRQNDDIKLLPKCHSVQWRFLAFSCLTQQLWFFFLVICSHRRSSIMFFFQKNEKKIFEGHTCNI